MAQKLISIPFKAVDRNKMKAASLIDVPLANVDLAYLIDVSIGTPPQPFTLLLDTGSSSTWVPVSHCGRYCGYPLHTLEPSLSSTFNSTHLPFSVRYGEGFSSGYYAQDTITINDTPVPGVNFAVSDYNDGELTLNGADGILGIGPDRLSMYNNPENKIIPTLVTTMHEKDVINQKIFSVYFQPITTKQPRINGEIVFGGVEAKHVVGDIKNIENVQQDALGQYIFPCNATNLPNITLQINNNDFIITPHQYLIANGTLTYSKEFCYTYIQDSPLFVDAILGYGFLQQYVSVYDYENKRIGFAQRAS
ncbi:hypothetical protein G6F49_001312 [Rhizopus delemar]|nr:hypothetical protein G6F49_001312 [Rhizopus delemar]